MTTTLPFTAGWINTTIHDFLGEINEPPSSMKYVLITSLDSSCDVASLFSKSELLRSLRGDFRTVGEGVLVPTRRLLAVDRERRVLFGFDELWFFPSPVKSAKPTEFVITGPDTIDLRQVERHADWLAENKCSLGLGDGTGMNYCFQVRGVAKFVVQAFNEANSLSQ